MPKFKLKINDATWTETYANHVLLGSAFAFVEPLPSKDTTQQGLQNFYGIAELKRRTLPLLPGGLQLPGFSITRQSQPFKVTPLVLADKEIYRAGQDKVNLLVALPEWSKLPEQTTAKLFLELNGTLFRTQEINLQDRQLFSLEYSSLPKGNYRAYLENYPTESATNKAQCKFSLVDYVLAPLQAALVSHRLINNLLAYRLKITQYNQPLKDTVQVELWSDQKQLASATLKTSAGGIVNGSFPLNPETAGRLEFRVIYQDLSAALLVPGSQKSERDSTLLSQLGAEITASLQPGAESREVRGIYINSDEAATNSLVTLSDIAPANGKAKLRWNVAAQSARVLALNIKNEVVDSQHFEEIIAGREIEIKVPAPGGFLALGAWFGERAWEGWASLVAPAKESLKISAPTKASPGSTIEIGLETSEEAEIYLRVYDTRLTSHTAQEQFGAVLKAGFAAASEWSNLGYVTQKLGSLLAEKKAAPIPSTPQQLAQPPRSRYTYSNQNAGRGQGFSATPQFANDRNSNRVISTAYRNEENFELLFAADTFHGAASDRPASLDRANQARSELPEIEPFLFSDNQPLASTSGLSQTPQTQVYNPASYSSAASQPRQNEARSSAEIEVAPLRTFSWMRPGAGSTEPSRPVFNVNPRLSSAESAESEASIDLLFNPPGDVAEAAEHANRSDNGSSGDGTLPDEQPDSSENAPRHDFGDIAFSGVVYTSTEGRASVSVKLPDALTSYKIEAFALSKNGAEWKQVQHILQTVLPVWAEFKLPAYLYPGDKSPGLLDVACSGGRFSLKLSCDGQQVDFTPVGFSQTGPGEFSGERGKIRFEVSPGLWRAETVDLVSGASDVLEREVAAIGSFKEVVWRFKLLQAGEALKLGQAGIQRMRVLPSLDKPFEILCDSTANYAHKCCEQTSAKLLAAVAALLAGGDTERLSEAVIAGVARQRKMYIRGRGFVMYPPEESNGTIAVNPVWGMRTAEHLRDLAIIGEKLFSNTAGMPLLKPEVRAALEEAVRMGEDVVRATAFPEQNGQITSGYTAYRAVVAGQTNLATLAVDFARRFLQQSAGFTNEASVNYRTDLAYCAAALLRAGAANDLALVISAVNRLAASLSGQGRLYSTVDSVAFITLLSELRASGISAGASGRVLLDDREMTAAEAIAASASGNAQELHVLDGAVFVETATEISEDWSSFLPEVPVSVKLERKVALRGIQAGDDLTLVIKLEAYEPGLLAYICLPPSLSRLEGGGEIKRFQVDFTGHKELRIPLKALAPTLPGGERWAVLVRNMFKEEQAGNPGVLTVQVKAAPQG